MSLGLFGTISLASRSLQTHQQAIEVAGHNLTNVNNPAYARQRLNVQSGLPIPTILGPQGTGIEAVAIQQIRSALVDRQIQLETSVSGYLESQQHALQFVQASLGQQINRQALGAEGAAASTGVAGVRGLAEEISDLFNAFQSLSTNPTSMAERQVLLQKAANVASQFNQVDQRLGNLVDSLNQSMEENVTTANQLLTDIARLNDEIVRSEISTKGIANDLRDLRQQKVEELSKLVRVDTSLQPNGSVNVSVANTLLVADKQLLDTFETFDAGGGQILVRTQGGGTPLALTGGSVQGVIDIRDGALANLTNDLNTFASTLITEVNAAHSSGYGLTGTTGANFFTGSDAATIGVNAVLSSNPEQIQASATNGAVGDNQVALALAQLADKNHPALNNLTFSQSYATTVSALGESLASVNNQIADQEVVQAMLKTQRDAISGVSLDEEMTDLIKFQRAFEASGRLVNVVDELLQTVINLGR